MKRPEYVKELIDKGLNKDQIIEELKKGNAMKGIKAVVGKDDRQTNAFANLIYNRIIKKLNKTA